MITDSETFRPVTAGLDTTGSFTDIVLLRETAYARLYRAVKAGKFFIIKTTKDNSAMQLSILKREYELSIPLNHHHISHIYTYEPQTPVGPGIVMEYIDGRNLSEYLAENPSADSRRRVFYQICDAVAYIHKNGIIHNDLKPENILISRTNNDVRLIDFGLSDNDAHYMAKTLGCTPQYASPELLAHDGDIDARSDIYSLGCIMQLIFGRKYSVIYRRCLNHDRNRRYDNVDQMRRHWLKVQKRYYFPFIATVLVLIALPSCFYLYDTWKENNEQQRHAMELAENTEKLRLAFTRRQDRSTGYQTVPPYVSIASLKSIMRLSENEILDAVENSNEFRLINLAVTRPATEKPEDRFAIEHFYLNRPYGCCIDRGSRVTIVSTSSWSEPVISNFSYYLAKIGGFNYISRETGEIGDYSWFNIPPEQKSADQDLRQFLDDITSLTSRNDSWLISLLSADGGDECTRPTQLHFTIGGKKGNETVSGNDIFVHDREKFTALYNDLSQTIASDYNLLSDLQRYHNSTNPNLFIRHLDNRNDINAFVIRISWGVTCWNPERIAIARTMAETFSRHLDPDSYTPDAPDLYLKDIGFTGYTPE